MISRNEQQTGKYEEKRRLAESRQMKLHSVNIPGYECYEKSKQGTSTPKKEDDIYLMAYGNGFYLKAAQQNEQRRTGIKNTGARKQVFWSAASSVCKNDIIGLIGER